MKNIKSIVVDLQNYIELEKYKGYDPYDLLKSPLFSLPILKSDKTVRFYAQQFGKRFPVNIRPLLKVPKGYNPVTLGLSIQAYTYLCKAFPEMKSEYTNKVEFLIDEIEDLIPKGFSGACWGYDFYWQARNADIPDYQPTIVATGIILNGLFQFYKISNSPKALELILNSKDFITEDLNTIETENGICFSYSPFDKQIVFNASMKAVRLLAQIYSITKDPKLKELAVSAVNFVMHYQRADGAWVYSDKLNKRIDNYHSGYVLTCLKEYIDLTGDQKFLPKLEKGFTFYKNNFVSADGAPKFYHSQKKPIDCTAAAQTILTLLEFNEQNSANKVANYMLENMFDSKGYFYFRKYNTYTIKTPFMRWSQAWMFAALSQLTYANSKI